jgi:ureidoacrylate peracid hydrolase
VVVASDGCAAFSTSLHEAAIEALRPVARIATIADLIAEMTAP